MDMVLHGTQTGLARLNVHVSLLYSMTCDSCLRDRIISGKSTDNSLLKNCAKRYSDKTLAAAANRSTGFAHELNNSCGKHGRADELELILAEIVTQGALADA